ncbi:hypothetical protein F2Q69_00062055 [Brassica cretica]|uniref:Uncharacterized protein n=1 Tax=Brassica cretica TaxID=69181 RepID=A0A8S9REN4_BRACR|nr:hypothetical protein F2Q69_00062055 [Brassica cretica]
MRSHDDGSQNERESDDGLNYWGDSKAPTTVPIRNYEHQPLKNKLQLREATR